MCVLVQAPSVAVHAGVTTIGSSNADLSYFDFHINSGVNLGDGIYEWNSAEFSLEGAPEKAWDRANYFFRGSVDLSAAPDFDYDTAQIVVFGEWTYAGAQIEDDRDPEDKTFSGSDFFSIFLTPTGGFERKVNTTRMDQGEITTGESEGPTSFEDTFKFVADFSDYVDESPDGIYDIRMEYEDPDGRNNLQFLRVCRIEIRWGSERVDATPPLPTGCGPGPRIQVAPGELDFGKVVVNSSKSEPIDIISVGTESVEIASISLDSSTSSDFVITGDARPTTLLPGRILRTEVTYTPTNELIAIGTLVIQSNAAQPQVDVPLSGARADIEVAPLTLDFGRVEVGSTSTKRVEVRNGSVLPLLIRSVRFDFPTEDRGRFRITSTHPEGLLPSARFDIDVAYTPQGVETDVGALLVLSAGQPPAIVELSGQGVTEPALHFRRGDVDNSGTVDITDAVSILNFLFGGTIRLACVEAGDIDNDGLVNITDPVRLLNYLFGTGARPAAPGSEDCGPDPAGTVTLQCADTSC